MLIPPHRIPIRLARGNYADLDAAKNAQELKEGEAAYARDQDALYVVENVGGTLQLIRIGGGGGAAAAGPTPVAGSQLTVLHELPGQPGVLEPEPTPTTEGEQLYNPLTHEIKVAVLDPNAPAAAGGAVPLTWEEAGVGVDLISGAPTTTPNGAGQLVFDRTGGVLYISAPLPAGAPGAPGFQWQQAGAAGGGSITVSATQPTPGAAGSGWYDPTRQLLFISTEEPAGSGTMVWKQTSPGAPPNGVFISPTPPNAPTVGDLWYNDGIGELFIWYDDGNTQQWVSATAVGGQSKTDATVFIGSRPPAGVTPGKLWFNDTNAELYIYTDDGTSVQWVSTSAVGAAEKRDRPPVHVSPTPLPNPRVGDIWFNSNLGISYVFYSSGVGRADWVAMQPSTQPLQPTRGVTRNVSVGGMTFNIVDGIITSIT